MIEQGLNKNDVSLLVVFVPLKEIHISISSNLSDIVSLVVDTLLPQLYNRIMMRPNISIGIAGEFFLKRKTIRYTNLANFTLELCSVASTTLDRYFDNLEETRHKKFLIIQQIQLVYNQIALLHEFFSNLHKNRYTILANEGFSGELSFKHSQRLFFKLAFVFDNLKSMLLSKLEYHYNIANIQYNKDYIDRNVEQAGKVTVKLSEEELEQFIDSTKHIVRSDVADYTTALRGFFFGEGNPIGKITYQSSKNVVANLFFQLYKAKRFSYELNKEECKAWIASNFEVCKNHQLDPNLKHALNDAFKGKKEPIEGKTINLGLRELTFQDWRRNK